MMGSKLGSITLLSYINISLIVTRDTFETADLKESANLSRVPIKVYI
jgi:hypothetical protein